MKHIPILALSALVATAANAAEPLRLLCDRSDSKGTNYVKAVYIDGELYGSLTRTDNFGPVKDCRDSTHIIKYARLIDSEAEAPLAEGFAEGADKWFVDRGNCSRVLKYTFNIHVKPSLLYAARWGKDKSCITVEHR